MFASNRHCKLIERKNTRYSQMVFRECKITNFTRNVFYFPSFMETPRRCLCSCARLRHTLVSGQNISIMFFNVRRQFCWISVTLLSHSRPSKDSILSYEQSDVSAPVCDLGTFWSHVRFFYILSGYKMHHNNQKYGEIVDDVCYIPK